MTTARRTQRMAVVGAGIGGPVLAMCLRRIGLEVMLVEARDSPSLAEGAFLGVAPNGMNVLAELGLADAVAARGHACERFEFSNRSGRNIGAIDRSRDRHEFGWPLTMIRRGDLHALLAEATERSAVQLQFGKRLVAIDRPPSRPVVARFADGSELEADALIGADGLRSTVRGLVMPDAPQPKPTGLLDYGGFARVAALPFAASTNVMVFGRRAFFGAFTTPGGETWWFHNGPAAAASASPAQAAQSAMRERLLQLHADDPAWIAELVAATPAILGPWPMHQLADLPRWAQDRVCLIGDAAHAMSPSAGQGASLAMEDAMVLAQCLREDADLARAFRSYEARRRPRVDAIARQARRSDNGKAVPGPVSEWFRDRMLPLFLRLGAAAQTASYAHRIAWEGVRSAER